MATFWSKNGLKFHPSPKIFDTSVTCDFCDKLHVHVDDDEDEDSYLHVARFELGLTLLLRLLGLLVRLLVCLVLEIIFGW